jgi:hypothetical protein
MREDQHDRTAIRQFGNGRQRSAQPCIVRHRAIRHWHVQVLADEHALAGDLTHVVERLESLGHVVFPYRSNCSG